MKTEFLKPAPGLKVPHRGRARGHVSPEGEDIVLDSYYRRRIADGDLVRAKRQPKGKEPKQ